MITGIVLAASLLLPKSYDATATVVLQEVDTRGVEPQDPESIRRRLATIQTVATGAAVLDRAAEQAEGASSDTIAESLEISVDPEANVIYITASSGDPQEAADTANAVTEALLEVQGELEGARLAAAREELLAQIEELSGDTSANAEAQLNTLRDELSGLIVREALTGFELQVAEEADTPTERGEPAPRPKRRARDLRVPLPRDPRRPAARAVLAADLQRQGGRAAHRPARARGHPLLAQPAAAAARARGRDRARLLPDARRQPPAPAPARATPA